MRVLIIGSGGREHALVWKVQRSALVKKVYCAPGNYGISREAACVDIPAHDIKRLLAFAVKEKIDLTIVGPEQPLVAGIVDEFEANGLAIFGPTQRAAELEGSKAFTKELLARHKIPSAAFRLFTEYEEAKRYLNSAALPLVIKADGLAAGKGVVICTDPAQAAMELHKIMVGRVFGQAGSRVVIEEYLEGEEVSVLALSDGEHLVYMAPAQDHKRIFDGDQGGNTGGMGAYAPTPFLDAALLARIQAEIMEPTIRAMACEDRPYRGVLYAGLILTREGPKVLEYNCRFGDPETQVILPLAASDLVEAIMASRDGGLGRFQWRNHAGAAAGVVIASGGYPGTFTTGHRILGLEEPPDKDIVLFHSGTREANGHPVTAGGRVLTVTAWAPDLEAAIARAYRALGKIAFDGAYYRKDIGAKGLRRK
ncbi:MAG TPA: phosphoribosylamine--glycine ligase [bacterium]|nr:phosphoribosylamine--glycine ligase [bacterium]HPR88436.1 phosphoribosylamine--glycine ligase [bacterium]